MPPRHGKTRTLILFCAWVLGRQYKTKIITSAYNDGLAFDFSKFVRNTISQDRSTIEEIIYSDIFPETKVKKDDSSVKQWALDKTFFTFKSAGKGGTITGKGGNYLIIDDPIKSAEDAFNMLQLEKDWLWYSGTWLSRKEHNALEIICHTPWAKNDIGGKIQHEFDDYYLFRMPACTDDKMLCEEILSLKEYKKLEERMNDIIFQANYNLKRIDVKGLLYGSDWKTYNDIPIDEDGNEIYQDHIMFCDTADTGSDNLCAISGKLNKGLFYVTDVYYTKESVETTEPELARRLLDMKINNAQFEANAGGHAIATHIDQILKTQYDWHSTVINCFTQTKNKVSRIMSQAKVVKENIIFPVDWAIRWPKFFSDTTTYLKTGKNKHDDAPDTLTQIVEYIQEGSETHFFIRRKHG
jgi:predicted phage terminase large subunit-like protein